MAPLKIKLGKKVRKETLLKLYKAISGQSLNYEKVT
jgi:hypothetical protein